METYRKSTQALTPPQFDELRQNQTIEHNLVQQMALS